MALGLAAVAVAFMPESAYAQGKALTIVPTIKLRYDTNPLRLNDQRASIKRDDLRATVGVSFDLNRTIGVHPIFLRGLIGYDKHTRFDFLDRARVDIRTGLNYAVFPRCSIAPRASLVIEQFDIEELGQPVGNTSTQQRYQASVDCTRPGLTPYADISYSTLRNSQSIRERADRNQASGTAGLSYSRPSLGQLKAYVSAETSDRPNFVTAAGSGLRAEVRRYGLFVSRAVSPIIQASGGVTALRVAARRGAPGFRSSGWSGEIRVAPIPRFVLTSGASRDVNAGTFGVAYAIQRNYSFGSTLSFARNRASLNFSQFDRRYVGEDPLIFPIPRVADRIRQASLTLSRPIGAVFDIQADLRYRERDSRNSFYDYSSVSAGLSLGGRF